MESKHVAAGQVAAGGLLGWLGSISLADWSYIVGILVAIAGLAGGFYWQWRQDKRNKIIMEATLAAIKNKGVAVSDDK